MENRRWKGDHWDTIDRHTYVPRFNQSLLKTLSRSLFHPIVHPFPRSLRFSVSPLLSVLEHAARADNVIERNADRIGWRE